MVHPAITVAFALGTGLAVLLYYIFNDNNDQYAGGQTNNDSRPDPRSDRPDSWDSTHRRPRVSRRNSGQSYCEADCTICLMGLVGVCIAKISPCGHSFHKKCIKHWQLQSEMAGHDRCPICRTKIRAVN